MIWLLVSSLLWAPSFGLIPLLLLEPGMNAYSIAFFRMLYSLILFLPLLRRRMIAVRKRWALIGIGAVQFGVMYVLLNVSYDYMLGYEVAMVTAFTPLYVKGMLNFTEKGTARWRPWLCVLLAVAGAGVIRYARPASDTFWIGFFIMQGANLCYALGQVLYRRMLPGIKRFGDMHVFGWLYVGALLVTLLAWAVWKSPGEDIANMRDMPVRGWMILLWLGLIPSGLAFFLFNHGALSCDPASLAIFNNLKIPLAMLVTLLLFLQWNYIEDWPRFLLGSGLMCLALWWNLTDEKTPS